MYDSATRLVISIGGAACGGFTFHGNQVWAYDVNTKTCVEVPVVFAEAVGQRSRPAGHNSGFPGLSYHPLRRTVLFHQVYGTGAPANWEYNLSADTYTRLSTIGGVTQSSPAAAVYDPIHKLFIQWSNTGLIWKGVLCAWQ